MLIIVVEIIVCFTEVSFFNRAIYESIFSRLGRDIRKLPSSYSFTFGSNRTEALGPGPVDSGPWISGSEHLLNSMRFWGELHVVCFNDKYAEGHLDQPDGLAVLGFFVDVS